MRPNYVWTAPDRPIELNLSLDLVSRLSLEALEAYKAVPRRGLEIGGLLLGRTESEEGKTTIYIEEFDPVESEHRSGPSYLLSETDLQKLDAEVSKHPDAIGIYRTQTRSNELSLQTVDTQLFQQFFNGEDRVFLLIRPADSMAEVFIRQNGELVALHEFSFRALDLAPKPTAPTPTVVERVPAVVEPAPAVVERTPAVVEPPVVARPVVEPPVARTPQPLVRPNAGRAAALEAARLSARTPDPLPRKRRWNWAVAAAALGLGALCGATLYKYLPHPTPAVRQTAVAVPEPQKAAAAPTPHVALSVERQGRAVRLLWDRNAPLVRNAAHAILYISDGSHNSQLDLDQRELGSGMVSYWPETQDVNFRLEVFSGNQSSDDSIHVVAGVPSRPTERSTTEPKGDSAAAAQPVVPPPPPPMEPGAQNGADRQVEPDARPSPFQPAPKPAAAPAPVQPIAATVVNEKPAQESLPEVGVSAEPVMPSRIGAVIGKIPLLRRIHKQKAAFVPPQPVREPHPSFNAQQRRALVRPASVTVKVYVTESGKVNYAELVSGSGPLAADAVYTARHWTFTPARVGEERVPSEVLLHFRYQPAATVAMR